jgi:hypothetical protein|eukprot:CAMPEP_0174299944 /NCGR_PEP_ID=MMETSP0809-20121228/58073_1 /TAXON_ID=73025 ORGANISM="Eutreptiella gymnastica-like, Strain CCMP1594" /NCGR_SAMPLE_ID=MMETSP0809 /ASSEMBLY_ACC=CAM_ASM_000658 /LENGTH=321 /DNA_ID=CAMNT_0015405451 /DNA_START=18 /DNA_END=983 /DNA_ORIENTATION=-
MRICGLLALWCILVAVVEASHRLKGDLLCSACEAVAAELTKKIHADEDRTDSILIGHRLNKNNKPKRQQYKGSELSAWEMMEGLCDSMDSYQLRQNKTTHRRYFSKNYSEPMATYYTDEEKERLKNAASKDLAWSCNIIVDEQAEDIIRFVGEQMQYDELANELCNKTTTVCKASNLKKYREKEAEARAKWLKAEKKRKKKEAKEAKKRKEEEEKRKAEEEEKRKAEELLRNETANQTETNGTDVNVTGTEAGAPGAEPVENAPQGAEAPSDAVPGGDSPPETKPQDSGSGDVPEKEAKNADTNAGNADEAPPPSKAGGEL